MIEAGTKDHPITIAPVEGARPRRVARADDRRDDEGARTAEAGYKPVAYIPREDVEMRSSTAPSGSRPALQGRGELFFARRRRHRDDNAVWTYEHPKAEVAAIAGHLAFYPNRVEVVRA